ncbi:MAG: imidazole glycerol phosphate synthase subunit HisF, partial [Anaerolineae bacterium]|nr:imidazole glycerol phosphate synthase subunit HisF [Anaerolineae bacterium]
REGADELVFLDIGASHEGRKTVLDMVRSVADSIFIPFAVGGGIRTIEDIRETLLAGADKVSINSAAVKTPKLIEDGAWAFGSQCIDVAIDPKMIDGRWVVHINGGRVPTQWEAVTWAKEVEARGAGEIMLTSMDRDGTKSGYDLELTRTIAEAVSIPVIASGGAGAKEHFAEALTVGKADAALAASLFHYNELRIGELKDYLLEQNIPVRTSGWMVADAES